VSKDELPVPTSRSSGHDIARDLDGTGRAKRTRNPISGFLHWLGSKTAKGALEADTAETRAFEQNLDAHSDGVRALGRLRDTVDDYQAREELAGEHYTNALDRHRAALQRDAHQREMDTKRQRKEQYEADHEVLNAEQGVANQRDLRGINEGRWRAKAEMARDKNRVEAAVHREALKEDAEASDQWWIDKQMDAFYEQLRQAIADGKDPTPYRDAIEALERLKASK
jgi:hypothetical protein